MKEVDQIRKSLDYGNQRHKEIRERIGELELLEEDLLSVKTMLQNRLSELEKKRRNLLDAFIPLSGSIAISGWLQSGLAPVRSCP